MLDEKLIDIDYTLGDISLELTAGIVAKMLFWIDKATGVDMEKTYEEWKNLFDVKEQS